MYEAAARGILHLFFDRAEFAASGERAKRLQRYGMRVELCPPDRCIAIEPALARSRAPLAGGLYAPDDESGDAHLFTLRLAALAQQAGVQAMMNTHILRLNVREGRMYSVTVEHEGEQHTLVADAYVLAAGSQSAALAREVGESLRIYPVKGYSITLPAGEHAPHVSITDESRRIVFSRLGQRLRVAGTAELNGYDTAINPARLAAILDRALEIFPDAGPADQATPWAGLRPAVPSNRPYIGRARIENLFFNTGHGTLGWTLACGSARALADIIAGREPAVKFPFQRG